MLEVPHNWSSGLRVSIIGALLGTVAVERLCKPQAPKNVFAELHAHLNIFLAKMT